MAEQPQRSRTYLWMVAGIGVAIGVARIIWAFADHKAELLDFLTLGFLCTPLIVQILSNASEFSLGKDGISWKRQVSSKLDANAEALGALNQIVEQLRTMTAHGVGGRPRDNAARATGPILGVRNRDVGFPLARSLTKAPVADPKLPGSRTSPDPPSEATVDSDDPQKGRWGGLSERNHRRLTAKVSPLEGDDDMFMVELLVESTQPREHPLEGKVAWHLHDTFTPMTVSSTVKKSRARLVRYAWGAFTVGAVADKGETKLELDLAQLPDAPLEFREQ